MKTFLTIAATCGLLTACGPLNEGGLGTNLLGMAQSRLGLGGTTPPPAPAIPAAVANAAPGEVLLVTLTGRGAVAPMVKAQDNGARVTWVSPGDVSMTFQNGILVSTRGLNDDLMGVDAPQSFAAILAGGGSVQRRHSFLDSEDQIKTRDLACSVTRKGEETFQTVNGDRSAVLFEEECTGPALVFTNKYWVQNGTIIRSNQAVSAGVGFIQADLL